MSVRVYPCTWLHVCACVRVQHERLEEELLLAETTVHSGHSFLPRETTRKESRFLHTRVSHVLRGVPSPVTPNRSVSHTTILFP